MYLLPMPRPPLCAPGPRWVIAAVITVAAVALPARAQMVGGLVRDSSSRLPAQRVEVQVRDSAGTLLVKTETDTTGVFYALLTTPARVRLHFDIGGVAAFDSDTMTVGADQFIQREFLLAIPRVLFEFQVEKQATPIRGSAMPRYPDDLRERNVEGEVLAQFVVDTAGAALMGTFKVLRATDPGFIAAVRTAVARMRFTPAEVKGQKVKQMVQQPFTFSLTRAPGQSATDGMPSFPDPQLRGRPTP
jgi:TonB family protein